MSDPESADPNRQQRVHAPGHNGRRFHTQRGSGKRQSPGGPSPQVHQGSTLDPPPSPPTSRRLDSRYRAPLFFVKRASFSPDKKLPRFNRLVLRRERLMT